MPDYGEILEFLAKNPPQIAAERDLHASLLELLAKCLRAESHEEQPALPAPGQERLEAAIAASHERWVHFG